MKHNLRKFLLLAAFFPLIAAAQSLPAPIEYSVAPETPGPHQTVVIEVSGVGSFLGSADITWRQDGAVIKSGVGERSYTFTTGNLGVRTVVQVSINSSQGSFSKTFSFSPSKINLVWEADTSLPQLYVGKALYTAGSAYKVVAFPTVFSGSSRIGASALSYEWSRKGEKVPEQSGLGRTVFTATGDQLQTGEDIAVDVLYGASKVGRGEIFIPASNPMIFLYERDALRGELLDNALPAGISLVGNEITLQAEPFYFSTAARKAGVAPFTWTLNDEETTGPDSARGIMTLRQAGGGQGEAQVAVSMQNNNPDQFVQTAATALRLVFGAQRGNSLLNFFGL